MRRVLFWSLLPFALPQALRARREAPRFVAAEGASTGVVGTGSDFALLAIGDSIVAGVGAGTTDRALASATATALARRLPYRVHWTMVGKIGAGVRKLSEQLLPTLTNEAFDAIVVSIGVNDITALRRSGDWARELGGALDALRERYPHALIAVAGIPPFQVFPVLPSPLKTIFALRGRTFDRLLRVEVESRERMVFVSLSSDPASLTFSSDGFHPSPESYAQLGRAFADALVPRLHAH